MQAIVADRDTRSGELISVLQGYDRILIVTHDNPDPDAIATGWAVQFLVQQKVGIPSRLVGGGAIIRAENRHMVKLLNPPIELVTSIQAEGRTAGVLVDCGIGGANHLLKQTIQPVAVIDHHPLTAERPRIPFEDVRPHVAASATIAASYLREQQLEPGTRLATALLYAIRTETRGFETYHSRLDRSILTWLTERGDPAMLAEIESAPLPRSYFGDLVLALQNTFIYDDAALCLLPRADGPEIVGEVADLLIRCQGVERVFCGAVYEGDLIISVRTERAGDDAAELLQRTIDGLGFGGGHEHRAGGKIPHVAPEAASKITEDLQDDLRSRWLAACNVSRRRGTRLVARREIVENL